MLQRISGERVLMPTSEACKLAGLSQKHIQRLLRDKRIEGVKVSHDWLVYEDSLLAFAAQPRKPGPKGTPKKRKQDTQNTTSGNMANPLSTHSQDTSG